MGGMANFFTLSDFLYCKKVMGDVSKGDSQQFDCIHIYRLTHVIITIYLEIITSR